ncbi:GNAT family N-acetyltransferase [Lelliottia nimipressuralis]|uniref:GNAT family N-acetyltransferase n=1 Tax=Lelliottia nimipressuralis TaxID=69220 RepID=A0ABY3NYY4_9ENTR|nr:GNAT family N-acetyltransferase [Lelliottia nimipressuralis]RXJ19577.1 GNAT family N-acetyltransferase [Lelliottia nimipressuralis]TYT31664.1 GNAT family N-acetyltransferase [Lelliottia nimipressuralis]
MTLRLAAPEEAERLWLVRNLAIRAGCQSSYDSDVIARWTPEAMPESYRQVIIDNPFYVVDDEKGEIVASGYLDLAASSVEAVFTVPEAARKGLAGRIIAAIKAEARARGISQLTLSSTPNAQTFYQRQGFVTVSEGFHYSRMADAQLRCIHMTINLTGEETL